jgi:hypothetical protein
MIKKLRGFSCSEDRICEGLFAIDSDPEGLYVQGSVVTDPDILAGTPAGEVVIRVTRSLLPEV